MNLKQMIGIGAVSLALGCGGDGNKSEDFSHPQYTCASGTTAMIDTCTKLFPDYVFTEQDRKELYLDWFEECEEELEAGKSLSQFQKFFECYVDTCREAREPITETTQACEDKYWP